MYKAEECQNNHIRTYENIQIRRTMKKNQTHEVKESKSIYN